MNFFISVKSRVLTAIMAALFTAAGIAAQEGIVSAVADDQIMTEKSKQKIQEMAAELHQKTGMSAHYAVIRHLKNGQSIIDYENELSEKLTPPYALIVLAGIDKKTDLKLSPDLEGKIDKDDILDNYMVSILVEKRAKMTDELRFEAAVFNGMTKLIYDMAALNGKKLDSVPDNVATAAEKYETNRSLFLYGFLAFLAVTVYVLYRNRQKNK